MKTILRDSKASQKVCLLIFLLPSIFCADNFNLFYFPAELSDLIYYFIDC